MYDNDNLSFEQVYVLLIIGVIGIAVWLVAGGFNRQIPDAAPACVASQSSNSAYSSFYGSGYRRRCGFGSLLSTAGRLAGRHR